MAVIGSERQCRTLPASPLADSGKRLRLIRNYGLGLFFQLFGNQVFLLDARNVQIAGDRDGRKHEPGLAAAFSSVHRECQIFPRNDPVFRQTDRHQAKDIAAFVYENLNQEEAKEAIREKLQNKYNQLNFKKSKEIIKPKYEAAMLLF